MGATADKLSHLWEVKKGLCEEINRALVDEVEGVSSSGKFRDYKDKLEEHSYILKGLVERSLKTISSSATSLRAYALYQCTSLTSASFPKATSIGIYAFNRCSKLTSVDIPNATSIGSSAFYNCPSLTSASFPEATSIGNSAFYGCSSLTTLYIGTNTDTVCTLSNTNAIPSSVTKIYVPASLVASYKSATNWSNFANKIVAEGTVPIGGKIFYDAGDNGATYTFYDSNGNVVSDTSISGLQNAVSYTVKGTPSSDRFYAVYPSKLNGGNAVRWGFYYNADIKDSGGNIVNTGTAIGTGKTATRAILNYIDTYASNEVANTNQPSSDISQASHNGYNLYKNYGTEFNYLWDIIRDTNNNSLGGHNDWFIPSKEELRQIDASKVISSITKNNDMWSGSAYSTSISAWNWSSIYRSMFNSTRNGVTTCLACRAF